MLVVNHSFWDFIAKYVKFQSGVEETQFCKNFEGK